MKLRYLIWTLEVAIFGLFLWGARGCLAQLPEGDPMSVDLTAQPADRQVTLQWQPSNLPSEVQAVEYRKRLDNRPYGDWESVPHASLELKQHTIDGLQNGLVYVFRVQATYGTDAQLWSNEVTAVPSLLRAVSPVPHLDGRCGPHGVGDGDELETVRFRVRRHAVDLQFEDNGESLSRLVEKLGTGSAEQVVLVMGYASATGSASYNLDLSERRAHAVVNHLGERSVEARFFVLAMGERHDEPIPGGTEERHQRVVVRLCRPSTADATVSTTTPRERALSSVGR